MPEILVAIKGQNSAYNEFVTTVSNWQASCGRLKVQTVFLRLYWVVYDPLLEILMMTRYHLEDLSLKYFPQLGKKKVYNMPNMMLWDNEKWKIRSIKTNISNGIINCCKAVYKFHRNRYSYGKKNSKTGKRKLLV